MRRSRRITSLAVVLGAILALGAAAASAQTLDPTDDATDQPYIVLTGHLTVEDGTTVEDAVIFDGDATIDGRVNGNAVALNGDVVVNGDVSGDVIALNGRVTVAATGSVAGNVMSRLEPVLDGEVGGDVQRNGLRTDGLLVFGRVAFWLAASISSLLFGLLWFGFFPRGGEAVANAARTAVGGSIGFGFMLFLGIPILGVIMLVTIVGGLFGVALLTGMVLLYSVAYTAGALALGRLLLKEPRKLVVAFLLGWVILRVLALVPVLGGTLFAAATVWGFGAIVVAAWRTGHDKPRPVVMAPAVTAGETPPMPPLP